MLRIPIGQLQPSALNPRRTQSVETDAELLASIKAHGILTPLLVRALTSTTYEIVAGHRRWAAAVALGLETVPVTVRTLDDDQAREAAIIENLQREDLAPLDEAVAYDQLLARPGQTPAMVAAVVGKSPAYVGRRLKLLTLVPEAQTALREGVLGVAHAELLTKLEPAVQTKALAEAVWLPLYARHDDVDFEASGPDAHYLEPIGKLREWVDRRTRLDLADAESLALFPDAAELVEDLAAKAKSSPIAPPLEVALDRFGQSPAKDLIPAGVLRLNKDFRQVTGKKCSFARRAIVVFGDARGDVVTVCTAKKACTTHWPPKEKADPKAAAKPRMSWEEQEKERKRISAIWARVRPDVERIVVAASVKVKTTPKILRDLLDSNFAPDVVSIAMKAIRTLTPGTFGRALVLVEALSDLYDVDSAKRALATVGATFDLAKAMKAAEAAAAAEAVKPKTPDAKPAAAKKSTKKPVAKPAKQSRRVA